MMKEKIHVCYAVYDKDGTFSKYAGTSMTSLLENTGASVTVHLFHDVTLSEENRKKFEELAERYGQSVRFYDMEVLAGDVLKGILEILPEAVVTRFSQAALYRLLAGLVLPREVNRVIYLDSDIIVHMDIRELWNEDTGENGLAAVDEIAATQGDPAPQPLVESGEVARENYFNSGVLLIDLDRWRAHPEFLTDGLSMLTEHPACFCFDQDILNYAFAAGYRKLDARYDVFVSTDRRKGNDIRHAVYHYAGEEMDPFGLEDAHNRLYVSYFAKSPWCSEEFLMRLFQGVHAMSDRSRFYARGYFNAAAGRRRIFCGSRKMWDTVKECFVPKPGEAYKIIIDEKGFLAVGPMLRMMEQNRGSLFVFFTDLLGECRNHMENAGFREMEDFIDGFQLMREEEGGMRLWGGDFFRGL